jgi:hypothetical protein
VPVGDRSNTVVEKRVSIGAAVTMLIAAITLANVSIGGTSDTPCGSILSPSFSWYPRSQCGLVYRGTLAVVVTLALLGCALLVLRARVVRRTFSLRVASLVTVVVVSVGVGSVGVLAWCASVWPEPVLRRGWIAVRNLAGLTTLGIAIVGSVVAAVAERTALRDRLL